MGSIINQKEIEMLLNSITVDDTEDKDTEKDTPSAQTTKEKVFKLPRKPVARYTSRYLSPVLKPHQFVFNPPPGTVVDEEKYVVQSLDNYILSRRVG